MLFCRDCAHSRGCRWSPSYSAPTRLVAWPPRRVGIVELAQHVRAPCPRCGGQRFHDERPAVPEPGPEGGPVAAGGGATPSMADTCPNCAVAQAGCEAHTRDRLRGRTICDCCGAVHDLPPLQSRTPDVPPRLLPDLPSSGRRSPGCHYRRSRRACSSVVELNPFWPSPKMYMGGGAPTEV